MAEKSSGKQRGRPFKKGQSGNLKGRPKGLPNIATREHKEFCRQFLESEHYRQSVMQRVLDGKAPFVETLMAHYAYGQPKRELEITTKRPTTFVLSVDDETVPDQPKSP